jgi:hypothetical protein
MTSIAIIIAIPKLVSSPWFATVENSDVGLEGLEDGILLDWWAEQELKPDWYPCIKVSEWKLGPFSGWLMYPSDGSDNFASLHPWLYPESYPDMAYANCPSWIKITTNITRIFKK